MQCAWARAGSSFSRVRRAAGLPLRVQAAAGSRLCRRTTSPHHLTTMPAPSVMSRALIAVLSPRSIADVCLPCAPIPAAPRRQGRERLCVRGPVARPRHDARHCRVDARAVARAARGAADGQEGAVDAGAAVGCGGGRERRRVVRGRVDDDAGPAGVGCCESWCVQRRKMAQLDRGACIQ